LAGSTICASVARPRCRSGRATQYRARPDPVVVSRLFRELPIHLEPLRPGTRPFVVKSKQPTGGTGRNLRQQESWAWARLGRTLCAKLARHPKHGRVNALKRSTVKIHRLKFVEIQVSLSEGRGGARTRRGAEHCKPSFFLPCPRLKRD